MADAGLTTGAKTYQQSVAQSAVVLVSRDPGRLALVISAPITGRLTLAWGADAVDQQGVVLAALGPPLVLTRADHGAAVVGPISAIMSAGTLTVGVLDVAGLP